MTYLSLCSLPRPRLPFRVPPSLFTFAFLPSVSRQVVFVTLLLSSLLFLRLDSLLHDAYYVPEFTVSATSTVTNLSLQISGSCRRIVYCGVDSRLHLLSDYDAHAVPLATTITDNSSNVIKVPEYDAAHFNWARILLIRTLISKCPSTQWIVYSDTDAYVPSRFLLAHRLRSLDRSVSLAFQHGRWVVNSGVLVWRAAGNADQAFKLLDEWEVEFPGRDNTNFFAEQTALDTLYRRKKKIIKALPHGFVAWHLKGRTLEHKTELASMARRFTARTGPALRYTVLLTIVAMAVVTAIGRALAGSSYVKSFDMELGIGIDEDVDDDASVNTSCAIPSSSTSSTVTTITTTTKTANAGTHSDPTHGSTDTPNHSEIPYQIPTSQVFLGLLLFPLIACAKVYRSLFRTVTSTRARILYFLSMFFLLLLLFPPGGRKMAWMAISRWDCFHLLPNGRLLVRLKNGRQWVGPTGTVHRAGLLWRVYRRIAENKIKLFLTFMFGEVVEWSGVLWIYPMLLAIRTGQPIAMLQAWYRIYQDDLRTRDSSTMSCP